MTEHEHLIERTETWERRLAVFWKALILAGVVTIAVTAAFVVVTLVEVQRLGEANNRLNRQTVQIADRLEDCTTPGRACYDSGQSRTAEAVVTLNAVTKAAVICADRAGVITETEMESCIKAQLGK